MTFTSKEKRFLMSAHGFMVDMNQDDLNCPPHILHRILEHRAKKLGRVFVEFRSENSDGLVREEPSRPAPAAIKAVDPTLQAQIEAEKLF